MAFLRKIQSFFNKLIEIPSVTDPDEARRRKMLNIILLLLFALVVFIAYLTVTWDNTKTTWEAILATWESVYILTTLAIFVLVILFVYALNRLRYIPSWFTNSLFLVAFLLAFSLSDTPQELTEGRSVVYFLIPIFLASILLPPVGCFVIALVACIEQLVISWLSGLYASGGPPTTVMGLFIAMAIPAWLAGTMVERSLKETRKLSAQRAAILNSIPDGILLVDPTGRVLASNPAALRLLACKTGELTSLDHLIRKVGKRLGETLSQVALGTLESAQRLRLKERTLSVYGAPVEGQGRVLVLHDVTAEDEADRTKDTILALASHELRTPLANVLGYAELMQSRMEQAEHPLLDSLRRIIKNAKRMADTVGNICTLAQLQAGELKTNSEPIESARLSTLLKDAATPFLQQAGEKGIQTQLEISPPELVLSDPTHLVTITKNLASNAVKFTQVGRIAIRVDCPDEQHWQLVVQDSGAGIEKKELASLFHAFHLAGHHYVTRNTQGAGLGLTVVHQLSKLLGGRVSVESTIGEGSTFSVVLPVGETA